MPGRGGNGVTAEGTYKGGRLEGPYNSWHDNGQKSKECTYKNGNLEGLATEWDKDGNVTKQTRDEDRYGVFGPPSA